MGSLKQYVRLVREVANRAAARSVTWEGMCFQVWKWPALLEKGGQAKEGGGGCLRRGAVMLKLWWRDCGG